MEQKAYDYICASRRVVTHKLINLEQELLE